MHKNDGNCQGCEIIFNKYPGFNPKLKAWFKLLQQEHHEAHISCAGRGRVDQEDAFDRRVSKAHWGDSAHNYNCAIDIFVQQHGLDLYDKNWFHAVIEPMLTNYTTWYGTSDALFYELPHIELTRWHDLMRSGELKLVSK